MIRPVLHHLRINTSFFAGIVKIKVDSVKKGLINFNQNAKHLGRHLMVLKCTAKKNHTLLFCFLVKI